MNNWTYKGKEFIPPNEEYLKEWQGFVYCITDPSGKKYIGKKFFWRKKILPITKTRKKRKRVLVESDWKSYYGSNEELKSLVSENAQGYKREILRLCKTKGECGYYELREQMLNDVLLKPDEYYNAFVGTKIHRNHVYKKKD